MNSEQEVDFHWGEHRFFLLQNKPVSLQSMIDFEKFTRQLSEEKCINVTDF